MIRPGPQLFVPMIVASILAAYAVGYGIALLVVMSSMLQFAENSIFAVLGMLILAATPFVALIHLNRVRNGQDDPPPRPRTMALVMCAPAMFWGWVSFGLITPDWYRYLEGFLLTVVAVAVPAHVSLRLVVTFARLGWRR